MNTLFSLSFFFIIVSVVNAEIFPPIWPMPASYSNETANTSVSTAFTMNLTCVKSSNDLSLAFERFIENAFTHFSNSTNAGDIKFISVCLNSDNTPLAMGVDESYNLTLQTDQFSLSCNTVYGCYHGLETLSQLIAFDFGTQMYNVQNLPWNIQDSPRFPHRGLLIDTSNHYIPLRMILHTIDSMVYNKLNVLHFHLTGWVSFPFLSAVYPQLAKKGSFTPREIYTVNDLKMIQEYARQRGIRVMVELDTPGHITAMCYGMPEICPIPFCDVEMDKWALDFTNNETYEVVGNIWKELSGIFPDQLTHIGGDEVDTNCWSKRQYIVDWCKQHNMTVADGLLYFINRLTDILHGINRKSVVWQEVWNQYRTLLNKTAIVQLWLPHSDKTSKDVTSSGYHLIWSDSSSWYLDSTNVTWNLMYNAEPCNGLNDTECALVLGGEGCMWGETVDQSDLLNTIYPRMSAIAERLWSPRVTAVLNKNTLDRIEAIRCEMGERGIPAAPVKNVYARAAPPGPGSCFRQ